MACAEAVALHCLCAKPEPGRCPPQGMGMLEAPQRSAAQLPPQGAAAAAGHRQHAQRVAPPGPPALQLRGPEPCAGPPRPLQPPARYSCQTMRLDIPSMSAATADTGLWLLSRKPSMGDRLLSGRRPISARACA